MDVTRIDMHFCAACTSFRQREIWLDEAETSMDALSRLEFRLRLHTYVLSCEYTVKRAVHAEPVLLEAEDSEAEVVVLSPSPPDGDCAESYVYFAVRLCSPDREVRHSSAERACQSLISDDVQQALGAEQALALYPSAEVTHALSELYEHHHAVRPRIFSIWTVQGAALPAGLVNQAELQRESSELQHAALHYAMSRPDSSCEVFRHYYLPFTQGQSSLLAQARTVPSAVLTPALWGGLVKGDAAAVTALRRVLEREEDKAQVSVLLRLLVLSGDAGLYPVLRQYITSNPEQILPLMAMSGHREAITDIIDALHQPRTNRIAAQAWYRMTGQRLTTRPRLSVVEDNSTMPVGKQNDSQTEQELATPWFDPAPAEYWVTQHEGRLQTHPRWLLGEPLTTESLYRAASQWAGQLGKDVLDMLSAQQGSALGVAPRAWAQDRLNALCLTNAQSGTNRDYHGARGRA